MAQALIDAGLIILGKTNMTVSRGTVYAEENNVATLTRTGVCWNENDHDDARMVILRRANNLPLRRQNRDGRHNFRSLGESIVRAS